jgi:ATP-dependent Lon protease
MKTEASENVFPLLSLKDVVVFPHTIIPLFIENEKTAKAICAAYEGKEEILVCCRRRHAPEEPLRENIYPVGVSSVILQLLRLPNGSIKIFIQGTNRRYIKDILYDEDQLFAATEQFVEFIADKQVAEALRRLAVELFQGYCELYDIDLDSDVIKSIEGQEDPGTVCDMVISYTTLKTEKKQELLEDSNIVSRLEKVNEYLLSEIDIARIQSSMRDQTRNKATAGRKSSALEQMQPQRIPMENMDDEISALGKQLKSKNMPSHAREKAYAELKRLRMMPPMSAEATVIRNYIDWFLVLPWNEITEDIEG